MPREEKRNAVEWLVFGMGTVLTFAVAVFLVADAFDGASEIHLQATLGNTSHHAGVLEVPVRVLNSGGSAAVDVQLEVCAGSGECRALSFPEVPSESERESVAVFAPGSGPFTARIVSYRAL